LAAVNGLIRQILLHWMKLIVAADEAASRHWRGGILAFHSDLLGRYAPSMRQRIDLDAIWRSARDQLRASCEAVQEPAVRQLADHCPLELDALVEGSNGRDLLESLLRNVAAATRL
jgi:hypothetical protein